MITAATTTTAAAPGAATDTDTTMLTLALALQESWAAAIKRERSEVSIKAHLEGRLKVLKPITGEGVYNKLAADIRTVRREMEGERGRDGRCISRIVCVRLT